MMRIFSPEKGKRFSRFDLWIYRLFHWRWSKHFTDHPDLRQDFMRHMEEFHAQRSKSIGKLSVVRENSSNE
jgi:serine acetyltransferase